MTCLSIRGLRPLLEDTVCRMAKFPSSPEGAYRDFLSVLSSQNGVFDAMSGDIRQVSIFTVGCLVAPHGVIILPPPRCVTLDSVLCESDGFCVGRNPAGNAFTKLIEHGATHTLWELAPGVLGEEESISVAQPNRDSFAAQ